MLRISFVRWMKPKSGGQQLLLERSDVDLLADQSGKDTGAVNSSHQYGATRRLSLQDDLPVLVVFCIEVGEDLKFLRV